jgi:hypothetical protein
LSLDKIKNINMDVLSALLLSLFLLIFFVGITVFIIWFTMYRMRRKRREERSLESVLLEITVSKNNEVKPDAMEQTIASLYSIKKKGWNTKITGQPVVSFEIVAKKESIVFYVWTLKNLKDLIEKQIHGAYPEAHVLEVEEYNIFSEQGKVAYKAFQLKKDNYYPLKTFKDLPTDPLAAITSSLAKMGEGEAAAIQVLISPADSSWQKAGRSYLSSTKKSESNPEEASYNTSAKTLEAIENKVSKPGFEVDIRIVVVSHTEDSAQIHLNNLVSSVSQFDSDLNSLGSRTIRKKGSFIEDFIYRYHSLYHFGGNRVSILNSEEIASIFHFPNKLITTPHIHWLNAKTAPAPAQIPTTGLFLGHSDYRGIKRDVYMSEQDRQRHMYIIGRTGTGKSEFLKRMIRQDVKAGRGLCFIDPHGDAVEDILNYIPPERAEDVIYFRPSDTQRPMGLNLLEAKTEDQKHFVSTNVINMMYKLFDPYKTGIVGPRFEHSVRNAMLTIMSVPGTTFVELMKILQNPGGPFLQKILPNVQDPIIREFWTEQIAATSDYHKSETLDYINSKFGRFVTNKLVRNIIGQSKSSFDFREVMDTGKILLVNLSKGELGEENSSFLGLVLVPRILMAAMSRADIPEERRRDFYLYVDEFQNFATPDFAQILSEARKYRLNLTVANQFIGQVDEEVKNAVFGNVGTIISYRVGVNDASYLTHEYAPVFTEDDLLNIEKYHVYIKTIVGNEPVPPFSMDLTMDLAAIKKQANPKLAEVIKEMSRLKYGRDVRLVDAEIERRRQLQ